MEFVWHDGGRATCGFVGTTGDCVARAIAIATGEVYRDVYQALSDMADKTARHGIAAPVIQKFLADRGWKMRLGLEFADALPRGVVLVELACPEDGRRSEHMCCVIDHTVYDTWNPFETDEYEIKSYWTCAAAATGATTPIVAPGSRPATNESRLTQKEFEKILKRVKALHRTASNHASTEGEIRNALRAMQSLMLEHNLGREDIVDDDDVSRVGMTRRACPLNGSRACQWEASLAHYLTDEIFPTVQHYRDRQGHRTFFWFYGPVDDVEQTLGLFREMLITIATAARVKYGGHARGSGASYAEGYVRGLPRRVPCDVDDHALLSEGALVHARSLAVHSAADAWLNVECGIRLYKFSSSGRGHFDPSAHRAGKRDGAKHEYSGRHARKQITHDPQ
jgi:hypothetical protein